MSQEPDFELWEGWDDPLDDVARFIRAAEPKLVAQELYRLLLREQIVDRMLAQGLDPNDGFAGRAFYDEHALELTRSARMRLLEWCSAIASREG